MAIAGDKAPLLPGGTATFANYSSYSRSVIGVMVDIAGLRLTPTAADFQFRVGARNNPRTFNNLAPANFPLRF